MLSILFLVGGNKIIKMNLNYVSFPRLLEIYFRDSIVKMQRCWHVIIIFNFVKMLWNDLVVLYVMAYDILYITVVNMLF